MDIEAKTEGERHPTVQLAISKLEETKKKHNKKSNKDIVPILYPDYDLERPSYYLNRLNRLTSHDSKVAISTANTIIDDIRRYEERYNKEIHFSDLPNFFVSKNVCTECNDETGLKIQGLYLVIRKSNVDTGKIIISSLDVSFKKEAKALLFTSIRNNFHSELNRLPVHIETEGFITRNTLSSYSCIGVSKNIASPSTKSFIETMAICKNEAGSTDPITGYLSGNIMVNNNTTPFVSKVILIKIRNSNSENEIKDEIKDGIKKHDEFKENLLIKLHSKEELLKEDNAFYMAIANEQNFLTGKRTTEEKIKYILSKLDITIHNELGVCILEGFN